MKKTTEKITITLKLFKQAFPEKQVVDLPQGSRVRDLMSILEKKLFTPANGKFVGLPFEKMSKNDLLFILNGQLIKYPKDFDTPLKDGDIFSVFPVMSGG